MEIRCSCLIPIFAHTYCYNAINTFYISNIVNMGGNKKKKEKKKRVLVFYFECEK